MKKIENRMELLYVINDYLEFLIASCRRILDEQNAVFHYQLLLEHAGKIERLEIRKKELSQNIQEFPDESNT